MWRRFFIIVSWPSKLILFREISDYLERSNTNSNPDGIIWSLLLPFYIRGETPNRAEMSVIAGQVPQIGDQRPNWDSPTAKLKTVCKFSKWQPVRKSNKSVVHSGILGAFPLELFFRGSFWQWLVYGTSQVKVVSNISDLFTSQRERHTYGKFDQGQRSMN